MTLYPTYPTRPNASTILSLDTLANAANYFSAQWQPDLRKNQSRDLLRLLLYKLYAPPGGSLFHRHARSSHAALAEKLDLSREWTCKLVSRLREAGWIETVAPRLAGSQQQDISTFRPGKMLKRLLVMLLKSRHKSRVNTSSQKIPTKEQVEKNKSFLRKLLEELAHKRAMKT